MEKQICRRSKFATATGNSSSKAVNNNSNGSKRNALADLTNSLIPTEVLLDLCSNSISTSKAHDLLRRSQTSTFPISKSLQNSKTDSKSDTSIGSSNFNNVRYAQDATPVRRQFSNPSSANLGNEGRKLSVYSRRGTLESLQGQRKIDSELVSSAPVKKKMKDEGKVIPVHSSTTPSHKAKNKQKAVAVPFDLIDGGKERAIEKAIVVPLSLTAVEKLKDKVKATASYRSSTRIEKPKKATASYGSSTPIEKPKDKGKATASYRSSTCIGKPKKATASYGSSTPIEKPKDKGKPIAMPSSFTSAEKGKNKEKAVVVPFSHLNEQAEYTEKSTAMLINHPLNKKVRRNGSAAISSCPPLRKTKGIRDKLNEADGVKPSKAWSEPHPKKKRRCSEQQTISDYASSQEFEKQKAYFQEIDAFELPVEEVSVCDLD